jgi:hypothetical protein
MQPPPQDDLLVTSEEAARPDAVIRVHRGLFPGPSIKMTIPDEGATSQPLVTPFRLRFEFTPRNDAKVDLASVRMTYLKTPAADLTPRILSSLSAAGINLAHVRLPPGRHSFTVSALDTNGNRGSATYTILVKR